MKMVFLNRIIGSVIAGTVLAVSFVSAGEPSPKVVMEKSHIYISALKQYTFNATVTEELLDENDKWRVYKQRVSVNVERPDKLRVDIKSKNKDRTSFLNNGLFTMVDHGFKYYGQIKTPKQIDAALDFLFDKYGINAPLAALVYKDMQKRVHFNKSKYFGTREVAGVLCDYVAFRNAKRELHLWIVQGKEPVVRSFTLIDRTIKKKPRTTAFIEWNTHPNFKNDTFVFKPSKSLMKISVESAN
jgi:hypothetical protein